MEVLDVRLEVAGKAVDALGEQSDLDFGRTGVFAATLVLLHDLRFLRNLQCHRFLLRSSLGKPAF
jgi:hypothetical protein